MDCLIIPVTRVDWELFFDSFACQSMAWGDWQRLLWFIDRSARMVCPAHHAPPTTGGWADFEDEEQCKLPLPAALSLMRAGEGSEWFM